MARNVADGTEGDAKPESVPSESEVERPARSVYRASDMVLAPCARIDNDGSIAGMGCEGFVVFGPYAAVAGEADVWVRFEVSADVELGVSSDIVSNLGKRHLGQLDRRTVRPGVKRALRYRARLADGGETVEARIFIHRGEDASFKIANLEVSIH